MNPKVSSQRTGDTLQILGAQLRGPGLHLVQQCVRVGLFVVGEGLSMV